MRAIYLTLGFFIYLGCTPSNKQVNEELPEEYKTQTKEELVEDFNQLGSQLNTWNDLKKAALYNDRQEFDINDFDLNDLRRIDSTIFGKRINQGYSLKASYILAVKEKIGPFYPCVIYAQQYDSDRITNFLSIVMLDSGLQKAGNQLPISGMGEFPGETFDYYSNVKDSSITIHQTQEFECEDEIFKRDDGVSSIRIEEHFLLREDGVILKLRADTTSIKRCE